MLVKTGGIHDTLMEFCVSGIANRKSTGPGRPSACVCRGEGGDVTPNVLLTS